MTTPTAADKERAFEILHRNSVANAEQYVWWEESGALIAQALADERERAAKIADAEAEAHRLRDDPQRMDAARWVASKIRGQA